MAGKQALAMDLSLYFEIMGLILQAALWGTDTQTGQASNNVFPMPLTVL